MAYEEVTFSAGEVITTAKANKLGTNDVSFNDGTGIADDKILTRHIKNREITQAKTTNIPATNANDMKIYRTSATLTNHGSYASYTWTFPAAFANTGYAVVATVVDGANGSGLVTTIKSKSTTNCVVQIDGGFAYTVNIIAMGL
jgi:hypothetical protein